jgi:hypothetical protein
MIPYSILDPRKISTGFPYIVFWNQSGNLISEGIDLETNIKGIAPQSHAMISINPGEFVAQEMSIFNAYRVVPMETYMIKGGVLTFVSFTNNSPAFASAFAKSVQKRLTAPWWVTQYDYLGIVGQALHLPWIHTPGLRYCSIDVLRHMVNACPYLPKPDQLIINSLPAEINPELLYDDTLKDNPPFNQYGQWDSKNGVVIGG